MKYSLLPFILTIGVAASAGAWAGPGFAEVNEGPTQEEYEAALIIVQKYMSEENRRAAAENAEGVLQDGAGIGDNNELVEPMAVSNAGFSVFGSGQVEAASISAFTADGDDGALRVGNPDTVNEALSGRLVFHERLFSSSLYWGDLCGFQFAHNGAENTLALKGDCQLIKSGFPIKVAPLVVYDRDPGEPIMFNRTIGIGGTLFDGNGTGGTAGGGDLVLSFVSNFALTCNNLCQNHDMVCRGAYTLPGATSTCASTGSDVGLNLCMCRDE